MLTISPAGRRARVRRVAPLVLTAVALASLLAGCGTTKAPQSAPAPAGGSIASSHFTQPPGAAGSASPAVSPAVSVNGLAVCQSGSLRVTVNTAAAGAAAGSTYYPVDFTNTSGSACGMYGYPGVSFVTAGSGTGAQVGAAAQENPAFGKLAVRLAPGGVAHAWLQVAAAGNFPAHACQPQTVEWLKVFPPDQTVAVYVNHSFDACAAMGAPLLFVMPVRTGLGVRGVQP
ncbi:MAG: DUF4232 domain-containing protein [Streptosporangiaceae bacterium]